MGIYEEEIHVWNRCHLCGMRPIIGNRYECQTCAVGPDNDLCAGCYESYQDGSAKHPAEGSFDDQAFSSKHTFLRVRGASRDQSMPWLTIPWRERPSPPVRDNWVLRPEFLLRHKSFFGAYAFAIEGGLDHPKIVLTALHVMDALIRYLGIDCGPTNTAYTGKEIPQAIDGVRLYDIFARNWILAEIGFTRLMEVLPKARIGDPEPYSQRDIAAFRLELPGRLSFSRLAFRLPAVGEPVWLAANFGPQAKTRSIPAVVVEVTEQIFIFRYAPHAFETRMTSGAPLLNTRGEVVGINVGGGFLDGNCLGHANHALSIRRHLGWEMGPF